MPDISDIQAASTVKIVGSDATGVEQTPVQSTIAGGIHANIRDSLGNESKITNTTPVSTDYGMVVRPITDYSTGKKNTYFASISFSYATNGTDIFNIAGATGKIIKVHRIYVEGTQTNDSFRIVSLIKRSTANSLGTAITGVPSDSVFPAHSALIQYYTANPTLGTSVGTMITEPTYLPKANSAIVDTFIYDYANDEESIITLRSANESISLNMNGQTSAGNIMYVNVVWTEE